MQFNESDYTTAQTHRVYVCKSLGSAQVTTKKGGWNDLKILIYYIRKLELETLSALWQESGWRMAGIQDQSFG